MYMKLFPQSSPRRRKEGGENKRQHTKKDRRTTTATNTISHRSTGNKNDPPVFAMGNNVTASCLGKGSEARKGGAVITPSLAAADANFGHSQTWHNDTGYHPRNHDDNGSCGGGDFCSVPFGETASSPMVENKNSTRGIQQQQQNQLRKTWYEFIKDRRSTPGGAENIRRPLQAARAAASPHHPNHFHPARIFHHVAHSMAHAFRCLEEHLSPKMNLAAASDSAKTGAQQQPPPPPPPRGGVLLYGCISPEEHYACVATKLHAIRDGHGRVGLEAAGLEYRLVPCMEHTIVPEEITPNATVDAPLVYDGNGDNESNDHDQETSDNEEEGEASFLELRNAAIMVSKPNPPADEGQYKNNIPTTNSLRSIDGSFLSMETPSHGVITTLSGPTLLNSFECAAITATDAPPFDSLVEGIGNVKNTPPTALMFCNLCRHRLFHVQSNTMVTDDNRREFVADGDMYEEVARLVQEVAQDIMIEEGNLRWVTIEASNSSDSTRNSANKNRPEDMRVLMSKDHPMLTGDAVPHEKGRPTILICTGRGKVRAGIFSRQHLIGTSIEAATAMPLVRDAVSRNLYIVILDPNVHGDRNGFVTFEKSMEYLSGYFNVEKQEEERRDNNSARREMSCRDMYVLSHSASGGHMARYFLDRCNSAFLRNIRAVAFTDSTHSIQWAKTEERRRLYDLLQGDQCVYFRCSRPGDGVAGDGNKWYLHPAGGEVQTDTFWQHRFGKIRTLWAGTNEHSLANWHAHAKIMEHFDSFLFGQNFVSAVS
jgi:hypothetical protein